MKLPLSSVWLPAHTSSNKLVVVLHGQGGSARRLSNASGDLSMPTLMTCCLTYLSLTTTGSAGLIGIGILQPTSFDNEACLLMFSQQQRMPVTRGTNILTWFFTRLFYGAGVWSKVFQPFGGLYRN